MNIKKWSVIFLLIVIVIALMGFTGFYIPGIKLLGRMNKNFVPMAPVTSVSFVFCAFTVLLFKKQRFSKFIKLGLLLLVTSVIVFGSLVVVDSFYAKELHFEGRMVFIGEIFERISNARMSPGTGAFFILSGFILLLQFIQKLKPQKSKINDYSIGWLNILLFFGSIIFTLAYIYGTPLLYNKPSTIPMALSTAITFIFLSLSITFSSNESFPIRLFLAETTRSYLFRNVLFLAVLSVILSSITIHYSELISNINPAFVSSSCR